MKIKSTTLAAMAFSALGAASSQAVVLANWTFETSAPTTPGPHAAEAGFFAANSFASTNSGGTISNPSGNGSPESFSSNGWGDGEYYQFLTSSIGYTDGIVVSFAQAASNTGPGSFQFQYSTDGTTYTNFGAVYQGPTGDFSGTALPENVISYDLSSVTGLRNATTIGFRVAVSGSTAENGSAIQTGGSFRVDDFVVSTAPTASAIPEPSAALLGAMGALALLRRRR